MARPARLTALLPCNANTNKASLLLLSIIGQPVAVSCDRLLSRTTFDQPDHFDPLLTVATVLMQSVSA